MIRVLIADDEGTIRRGLEKAFPWKKHGYKVVGTLKNGVEVMDFFKNNHADIVVCDIRMPRMTGLEVLKNLRLNYPNLPFIIISGYDDFKYVQQALQNGAFSYLLKPIKLDEFLSVLEKARKKYNLDSGDIPMNDLIKHNFFGFNKKWDFTGYQYLRESYENNYFCALNIRCNCNNVNSKLFLLSFTQIINNTIERLFPSKDFAKIEASPRGIVYCITSSKHHNFKNNITNLIDQIYNTLKESYTFSFSVSIGGIYKSINNFINSYMESFMKDSYSYVRYNDSPLNTISSQQFYDVYSNLFQAEDKIINLLIMGKKDDALSLLLEQKQKIEKNALSIGDAYLILRNILYKYINAVNSMCQTSDIFKQLENTRFFNFDSLSNMFDYVIKTISDISSKTSPSSMGKTEKNIEMAKIFIHENYSLVSLSLIDVAQGLGLNESYLSTEFKRHEGVSLMTYLTNYRIEKAKVLLINSSKKISSISNDVGYVNPSYFSTVFKRFVGETPIEYRKKMDK